MKLLTLLQKCHPTSTLYILPIQYSNVRQCVDYKKLNYITKIIYGSDLLRGHLGTVGTHMKSIIGVSLFFNYKEVYKMCVSEHVFSIDRLVIKNTSPVRNINQFTSIVVVHVFMFVLQF